MSFLLFEISAKMFFVLYKHVVIIDDSYYVLMSKIKSRQPYIDHQNVFCCCLFCYFTDWGGKRKEKKVQELLYSV